MSESDTSSVGLMPDPGEQLRRAREQAGKTLKEVSNETLIPAAKLRALEEQDLERVGGLAYVTGYTRAYARAVGIESKLYVRSFEDLFGVEKQQPVAPANFEAEPLPRVYSLAWIKYVFIALALIAACYGVLTLLQNDTFDSLTRYEPTIEPVKSAAKDLKVEVETPQANFESLQEFHQAAESLPEEIVEELEKAPEEQFDQGNGSGEFLEDNSASGGLPDQEQQDESSEPQDSLVMTFSDQCWVEVADAQGEVKIAQIAESGDNLQLFGEAPFRIMLGNADAAFVALNGEVVPIPIRAGRRTARIVAGQ